MWKKKHLWSWKKHMLTSFEFFRSAKRWICHFKNVLLKRSVFKVNPCRNTFFILGNLYFLKETATKFENQYVPNGSRSFSKNRVSKNRAFDFLKWSLKFHLEIHKSTNWILMENQGCFSKDCWMQLWKMWRQNYQLIITALTWY